MESVYHIVATRVNETSWAHVWRLHFRYLGMGYDNVTRFIQLSRYPPGNVDTNDKKQDWFLNGLNDGLASALEARDFINFQDIVDKALVLENRRGIMEQKRKMQHTGPQGSNMRICVGSSSQGPNFRLGQQIGQPRMQAMIQGFQTP
jgi:hypothetical protein